MGGIRLRLKWYIDQTGEKYALNCFKDTLGFGRVERKSGTLDAWRLISDSFKHAEILIPYFTRYFPKTTKLSTRFTNYCTVYQWTVNKSWRQHMPEIRSLMNQNKLLD